MATNGETRDSQQLLDHIHATSGLDGIFACGAISKSVQQSREQTAGTSGPSATFENGATSKSPQQSLEQTAAASGSHANFAHGETVATRECNECIVSVPAESSFHQRRDAASTTVTPQPEQDYHFGAADEGCCANCTMHCMIYYQKAWETIHSSMKIF